MSQSTKLCAVFFLSMTSLVCAGAQDIDDIIVKEIPGQCTLLPKQGTSDFLYPENVIEADEPDPDIPDDEYEKQHLEFDIGNVRGAFKLRWKPESFYGRNVTLLNSNVDADRIYFSRATFDANLALEYGKCCYGHEALEFFMTLRHKVIWGNPGTSASTAEADVKLLDSVLGPHKHVINRQFPWIREIWLRFCINDALGLSFNNQHYFAAGSFPFDLGRGIALGSAYAVNPGVLGFFSDNTIDQYAYGFNFSGQLVCDRLWYDLYGAILENLTDSFRATTAKVRAQEVDKKLKPQRGAGKVDYVVAGRLRWVPVDCDDMKMSYEPYLLYNKAPEQKIEFTADAKAQLGTFGLAGEFKFGNFEYGFDGAFNFGSQRVKGWDRNRVKFENRLGAVTEVNDRVVDADPTNPNNNPKKAVFIPGSDNQKAIQDVNISQGENGLPIQGTNPQLYNDLLRFRNGYRNKFEGWMFVIDAAYNFCDDQLTLATEVGIASGDEDPNKDLDDPNDSNVDGVYSGFIGLQEIYSGNRIKTAFILGGKGPRPLSSPSKDTVLDREPSTVSNFTNLVYVGGSLEWKPRCWSRYFMLKPNIIGYWQQHRTKKFDLATGKTAPNKFARAYYGTEINFFADVQLLKDFTMYGGAAVFFPGGHYKDIKGKPLNAEQQKILDRADQLGIDKDLLPLLGDDVAWTFNIGLEMRF